MINLTHLAVIFTLLWVLLYLVVYNLLLSPSAWSDKENAIRLDKRLVNRGLENIESVLTTNPFVPSICDSIKQTQSAARIAKKTVAIIIAARNEKKEDLFITIESLLINSGSYLKHIIIVDDASTIPINTWSEWTTWSMAKTAKEIVGAVTLPHRSGVAGARSMGANLVIEKHEVDVILFLDAHCVVSDQWLDPLLQSLERHPHALVYPMIDVMDPSTGAIIKADNVIGTFDWTLRFRWEAPSPSRTPLSASVSAEDQCMSPATPGIFGITSKFYREIGGLHTGLKYWGQENIEISLRVWLCGGEVIRQPCSRVAHKFRNLHEDAAIGNGVTQRVVDRNVMTVATQWMSPEDKERVYQARFTGRVPYKVEVSLDAGQPSFLDDAPLVSRDRCQDFSWFLKEVYPGLASESESVEMMFRSHLASDYLDPAVGSLLEQYTKKSAHAFDPVEIAKLASKEKEAKAALQLTDANKNNEIIKPTKPMSEYDRHVSRVRDDLLCEDFKPSNKDSLCPAQAEKGKCLTDTGMMMFACPKSCGLCGTDKKLCTDYFLKKCKEWQAEGQCDSNTEYMATNCRESCGLCRSSGRSKVQGDSKKKPELQQKQMTSKDLQHLPVPKQVEGKKASGGLAESVEAQVPRADPFLLQTRLKEGKLPDVPGTEVCKIKNNDNGKLLDRVKLDRSKDIALSKDLNYTPKIFCGIYTMEKNHGTNVRATIETWGKRCSGFMAFSTVTNADIPTVFVPHEGPEEYNNMWQKSKSIWKYIGSHYLEEFDWFLMGGDDMFYMVENLRDYLSSSEITEQQTLSKGMFIGRRFFPPKQNVFNSGGAGYILDRKALQILMDNIDTPKCFPHQHGFWEDVNIASCLRVSANILPYDTRDELKRERFHPFTPGQHLNYRIPPKHPDWYANYNPELKVGYECCSSQSISFHYCAADTMRRLAAYVYHCDKKEAETI